MLQMLSCLASQQVRWWSDPRHSKQASPLLLLLDILLSLLLCLLLPHLNIDWEAYMQQAATLSSSNHYNYTLLTRYQHSYLQVFF